MQTKKNKTRMPQGLFSGDLKRIALITGYSYSAVCKCVAGAYNNDEIKAAIEMMAQRNKELTASMTY
jgi:hypothetical protein